MQSKKLIVLGLVLLVLGAFVGYQKQKTETVELAGSIFVFDGDTFQAQIGGKRETVRLLGIDTPEIDSPYGEEECFGQEASEFLRELISGERLKLRADPAAPDRDSYNRLLRYTYREGDDLFINEEILREGYGKTFFLGQDLIYKEELLSAERQAQQTKSGLWLSCEGPLFASLLEYAG
ncbi:MAG: thermonuclease family protein [Candidatus Harrisonbacteria bacterium]|nr:thermonuclease family protein [Candidatus Harrisonbacteria bacterium]